MDLPVERTLACRDLGVFKTITAKQDPGTPGLAEKERKVLADTKRTVMAVANQKKKGLFDFPGFGIYKNLTRVVEWLDKFLQGRLCRGTSRKFQVILRHLIQKLNEIAGKYRETYPILSRASELVRPVFKAVTNPHSKHPNRVFKKVVKDWETALAGNALPKKASGMIKAALEFARSYEDGLFAGRKYLKIRLINPH